MDMSRHCCPFCGGAFEKDEGRYWRCMDCNELFYVDDAGVICSEAEDNTNRYDRYAGGFASDDEGFF